MRALTLNFLTFKSILNSDPGDLTAIVSLEEYPRPFLITITPVSLPFSITGFSFAPLPVVVFIMKSGSEKYSLPFVSTTTSSILPLMITGLTVASLPCLTVTPGLL